jgi:hypothetical protein
LAASTWLAHSWAGVTLKTHPLPDNPVQPGQVKQNILLGLCYNIFIEKKA